MPTFVKSAMNPNGSYQADPFDQADMNNRNQSLMAQLALAQLRSGDARFGAERADRAQALGAEMGYRNNELGMRGKWHDQDFNASQNALAKEYGYKDKLIDRDENHFNLSREDSAPEREYYKLQADIARKTLAAGGDATATEAGGRAAQVKSDYTADPSVLGALSPAEQVIFDNAKRNAGGNAAAGIGAVKAHRFVTSGKLAEGDTGELANKISDATPRAGAWFGESANDTDIEGIKQTYDKLVKHLSDSGLPPEEASQQAKQRLMSIPQYKDIMSGAHGSQIFGSNSWKKKLAERLGLISAMPQIQGPPNQMDDYEEGRKASHSTIGVSPYSGYIQ